MLGIIKRPQFWLACCTTLGCLLAGPANVWGLEAQNLEDLQRVLGFDQYYAAKLKNKASGRRVKIAVFDNGFYEYEKSIGTSLPADTQYIGPQEFAVARDSAIDANSDASAPASVTAHGRFMAEIVYALMTDGGARPDLAPEMYLFKVTGYTNLKTAIDEAIRNGVDVVLRSMVREYGSNYDGNGFFNAEVNRAINGGIVWVNAAGNFAKTTFNLDQIQTNADGWVSLPGVNNSIPLRCEKPKSGSETCSLRLVLSWNDFKDDSEIGTDKDLDLVITDDALNILQTSSLVQTVESTDKPGMSKYPREIIEISLMPGRYFVRVKNRSNNFGKSDTLRVSADGEFISLEKYDRNENLFNPADNPGVIAVGASDSDRSSRSVRLDKPDIFAPSLIAVSDTEAYLGTSNAAAIVTAGVGLLKMIKSTLSREDLLLLMSGVQRGPVVGEGISAVVLGFSATGSMPYDSQKKCYEITEAPQYAASYARHVYKRDGVFVNTTAGVKILTPYDPIQLVSGGRRSQMDDVIFVTPQGYTLRSRREARFAAQQGWVEIAQLPARAMTCSTPQEWSRYAPESPVRKSFRLPSPDSL